MAVEDVLFYGAIIFTTCIALLVFYVAGSIVVDKTISNPSINESSYSVEAFQSIETKTLDRFDYIIFIVFIGLSLSLLIMSWFISGYHIFMFMVLAKYIILILCVMR